MKKIVKILPWRVQTLLGLRPKKVYHSLLQYFKNHSTPKIGEEFLTVVYPGYKKDLILPNFTNERSVNHENYLNNKSLNLNDVQFGGIKNARVYQNNFHPEIITYSNILLNTFTNDLKRKIKQHTLLALDDTGEPLHLKGKSLLLAATGAHNGYYHWILDSLAKIHVLNKYELSLEDFDHIKIADLFSNNGAACLSVLTEEKYFLGSLNYIKDIKKKNKLPILAKDFFIDPFQVSYSKSFGCDCILIILSALSKKQSDEIYDEALKNKLSVIVEVHDEKEAEYALKYEEAIIGINNRDLKSLEISLENSVKMQKKLVSHKSPLVSESGIKNKIDAQYIYDKTGIKIFLIGESLLASGETDKLIKEIMSIN